MISLYLDTLVFGMQKMGGVSVVWNEYIDRMLKDEKIELTLLDIKGEYINYIYKNLDTKKAKHIDEFTYNLQLLRNMKPIFPIPKKPIIFQSTYLRTCKKHNVKNVIMIHDITHQLYFKGIKKWLNTFQKIKAIKNADGIICVSRNTLKDLHKYFPASQKVKATVIYNSASTDYKVLPNPLIPERYKELNHKKFFIYVGDRFPYKNTEFLIRVLKKRSDLDCVMIGGSTFSISEINEMQDIKKRVHHFTNVTNKDLNELYNCAFCMIYPSLYEGFGIPILEAMRAGCPVIAFNNSSIPEVLRGSGFLLENNDLEGALEALKDLENQANREFIIKNELIASQYFCWEKSYRKLVDFYTQIVEQ